MKWLKRLLGHSEYRQYGDNEYYEYPRNGVYLHESSNSSSNSSGWRESRQFEVDTISTRSWRGPCVFEQDPHSVDKYQDMYSRRGTNHPYRESRQLYENEEYSRDTSRYVSQYGGTTEIYNPASGGFKEYDHGRVNPETPVYDNRRYRTMNYEDHDARSDALARAMQDTLSLERYPASYGAPGVAPAPNPMAARATGSVGLATCAGCHRTLGFGRFLTCLNQNWHPACFCCRYCLQGIVDKEFSVHGNDPYHRDCYKKLFHPKCEICYNHIPLNPKGQIEYRSHPFWNQRYCPSHELDGSQCCCSCDRIQPVDQRYRRLPDGRKVCSECMDSAVMTTKDCQPLYRDVLKFYRNLGMPIEQEISMLLVEREALNHAREVEEGGHTHAPETRGLCLSEEQILPVLEHDGEMRKLTRHCEVTAILVLYGLPRLLTGSILAHELMHAWIRLDGRYPNLDNDVEEGICQVIAHMWLKSELETLMRTGVSLVIKRLGEFFLHQIETDSSPIYGDGFRTASAAVSSHGLTRTLHHLRQTGEILH
ncbi:protein DA1-related 1 isoform X1 [Physcomitrium patens]|uniref:LIM zinc-binding domain-containing protein n=1 Tax=Physcomitrium patens TaxID=3218 RepID=A0A2K1ID44_PHYPA|nr:protein DA1-related 1-like isoform X1 [Physcomitrium patens]XP_024366112.1 protein DA1-related 1-like isoform X1 [Physcomitrium patens]XP_024366113.1 protein DA1-related 1-like isoform X1 [Physcomitrium patens]XP_024366114.1 protein DA1-related 1-like isoform X1 [Physcomitrium patens]XP_024366115.1 protein DA1-related 1-like isoform X1 [Physcomitrium patens]XP_024366116.1 protein DA1-related 1-like isoform X1 [Physcomitrium patens]PNR27186.1 hypothetical protein PHYPA_030667 [Physcomitrium|eukprot:XP_024366111.1 protein DA1-related 1-like isoform X1 [Physcomitrella patens]